MFTKWLIAALPLCSALALGAQTAVDSSIKPGDDFFAYANGGWLKATRVPPGKERWGARDEINAANPARIDRLFEDARSAPPGSLARAVADFQAAWLDEAAIEARGIAPIQPLLDSIGGITTKDALTRIMGRQMRADVDPLNWGVYQSRTLFGLSVEPSIHGEKTYVAFLLQGGLGLPDREPYLSAEPTMQALRERYVKFIAQCLAFGGADHANERAGAVLALETQIAQSHATAKETENDHNADNVWARADFARKAPGIDWEVFFAAAGLGNEGSIVAWQPAAVSGTVALVASQPLETWKDYLRFHAVAAYAGVLPRAVGDPALALHDVHVPRSERARQATLLAMSDAIGQLYAARYFSAAQKAHVERIVGNVTAAFIARVEAATWMSPATKAVALAKLRSLYVGIGYPDRWPDHSRLVIDPHDAIGNVRRVEDDDYRRALARLGTAIDQHEWLMPAQNVGALLVFQQNLYDFSAGLLQAPKFDSSASEAASYGAIGAIIGHDVSHFVDVLGAEYAADGTMRRWWTAGDSARYQALAQPLVDQFSAYRPFPDAAVNGKLTQTENIADLAGLASAFDAYRKTLGDRVADKRYVKQQDRAFFIAFAQAWRVILSDEAMRKQLANDHAPEMYRVSTVRNLDAWYEAFDVVAGQRLYLEPKARVRVW